MVRRIEEKPVFDKEKADLGIRMASEQFEELDLTLIECFWACHCLAEAAAGLLGKKYSELAEMMDGTGES